MRQDVRNSSPGTQSERLKSQEQGREDSLARLHRLARLLDSSIALPGGYRIGLDGILGLVPVAGDSTAAALSAFIVIRAARMGVAVRHLMIMMMNVIIEMVVGMVPVAGDLFDFVWKANEKNMALLEKHLPHNSPVPGTGSRLTAASILLLLLFVMVLVSLIVLTTRVFLYVLSVFMP